MEHDELIKHFFSQYYQLLRSSSDQVPMFTTECSALCSAHNAPASCALFKPASEVDGIMRPINEVDSLMSPVMSLQNVISYAFRIIYHGNHHGELDKLRGSVGLIADDEVILQLVDKIAAENMGAVIEIVLPYYLHQLKSILPFIHRVIGASCPRAPKGFRHGVSYLIHILSFLQEAEYIFKRSKISAFNVLIDMLQQKLSDCDYLLSKLSGYNSNMKMAVLQSMGGGAPDSIQYHLANAVTAISCASKVTPAGKFRMPSPMVKCCGYPERTETGVQQWFNPARKALFAVSEDPQSCLAGIEQKADREVSKARGQHSAGFAPINERCSTPLGPASCSFGSGV
jgi:hypothetical protein